MRSCTALPVTQLVKSQSRESVPPLNPARKGGGSRSPFTPAALPADPTQPTYRPTERAAEEAGLQPPDSSQDQAQVGRRTPRAWPGPPGPWLHPHAPWAWVFPGACPPLVIPAARVRPSVRVSVPASSPASTPWCPVIHPRKQDPFLIAIGCPSQDVMPGQGAPNHEGQFSFAEPRTKALRSAGAPCRH